MPKADDLQSDVPNPDDDADADGDPDHALPLRVLLQILDFVRGEYGTPETRAVVWRNGVSSVGAIDLDGEALRFELRVRAVDDDAADVEPDARQRVLH